jgi:hypothetical protein
MGNKRLLDLHLRPEDFLVAVGVLFAAVIATYFDLVRQHGKGRNRIRLSQQNMMLIPKIELAMEAAILANHHPIVVGFVIHQGRASWSRQLFDNFWEIMA